MDLKKLEESALKEMEEFAQKYPKDIGCLYDSYKVLITQTKTWEKPFLEGYLACVSDLIILKKGLWV